MKTTLLTLALMTAGAAAVSVAEAQPAHAAPPAAPAPTTTADPNAPPAAPSAAPSAAPVAPPVAPTADPNAPPVAPPPAGTGAPPADPNAPPPPPPVTPPPPVAPAGSAPGPVAPPPTQFVPPPAPQVNWTAAPQPGGDTTTPTDKPKPLRWRGTTFEWYQYANTQYFGVGSSYIGKEDFAYVHLFRFAPNFYVVDDPKDKVTVGATLWGSVEATDSNTTTYKNEFELRDTILNAKYTRTLLQSPDAEGTTPEWLTKAGIGGSIVLPTSKPSICDKYLGLSLAGNASQTVKLNGSKSDLFPNLNLGFSLSYTRNFNKTNIPTCPSVTIHRQTAGGDPIDSDEIGKYALTRDNLIVGGSVALPIYKDLSFNVSYRYWAKWKENISGLPVKTPTGDVVPAGSPQGDFRILADTIFDVGVSYVFFDVLDAAIGYSNWTSVIGESGTVWNNQHNPFYSADATFYLDLTANLDAIYSKATNRDKKTVAKGYHSSWF